MQYSIRSIYECYFSYECFVIFGYTTNFITDSGTVFHQEEKKYATQCLGTFSLYFFQAGIRLFCFSEIFSSISEESNRCFNFRWNLKARPPYQQRVKLYFSKKFASQMQPVRVEIIVKPSLFTPMLYNWTPIIIFFSRIVRPLISKWDNSNKHYKTLVEPEISIKSGPR